MLGRCPILIDSNSFDFDKFTNSTLHESNANIKKVKVNNVIIPLRYRQAAQIQSIRCQLVKC